MKTYYDSDKAAMIDRLAEEKLADMLVNPVDSIDLYDDGEIILEINGNGITLSEQQLDAIATRAVFILQERDKMMEEMDRQRQWDDVPEWVN